MKENVSFLFFFFLDGDEKKEGGGKGTRKESLAIVAFIFVRIVGARILSRE